MRGAGPHGSSFPPLAAEARVVLVGAGHAHLQVLESWAAAARSGRSPGPVLDANLRCVLAAGTLRSFGPERNFLTLLNLGNRRALATKRGLATAGHWAWLWKDRIDRGFVERSLVDDGSQS